MDEPGESGTAHAVGAPGAEAGDAGEAGEARAPEVWDDEVWESTAPWAMEFALDDDRADRPTHLAACEATATAAVTLLSDPRAVEGQWRPFVARWVSGPIRKVVRRGRGVRFAAVQELPGVLVEHAGARVRAFVPVPIDHVPPVLAKLQVGGTDLPDRSSPSPIMPLTVTIALTPLVAMTTGKAAAQSAHAAQLALQAMDEIGQKACQAAGFPLRVVQPDRAEWRAFARSARVAVHDGGFTEVAPGTQTALAAWSS